MVKDGATRLMKGCASPSNLYQEGLEVKMKELAELSSLLTARFDIELLNCTIYRIPIDIIANNQKEKRQEPAVLPVPPLRELFLSVALIMHLPPSATPDDSHRLPHLCMIWAAFRANPEHIRLGLSRSWNSIKRPGPPDHNRYRRTPTHLPRHSTLSSIYFAGQPSKGLIDPPSAAPVPRRVWPWPFRQSAWTQRTPSTW